MRHPIMAAIAAALAIPAAIALPTAAAQAQHRHYDRDDSYHGRTWRDDHGRMRCRKPDGTTGLLIGGVGGALVGRSIDTHGDRTLGTLGGAAAGALAGRAIERSGSHCR